MEPGRWHLFEALFLVDLVDRDPAVFLQRVQEEEDLGQLLGLLVLTLLAVAKLELEVFALCKQVYFAVRY